MSGAPRGSSSSGMAEGAAGTGHGTGRYVVAFSGASGIVYGVRLLEVLLDQGHEVHLVVSDGAFKVARHEMGIGRAELLEGLPRPPAAVYDEKETAAKPASGSFLHDGMFVVPASLKTTAGIAHGYAENLVVRSALVCLKEGRPLVVCPRDTPLDLVSLRNWVTLKEAGASVVPAMPGFYHRPETIDDLVDHLVGKLLDQMRIPHDLFARWEGPRQEG